LLVNDIHNKFFLKTLTKKNLQRRLHIEKQFGDGGGAGGSCQHLCQTFQNVTKAKRFEEVVLMHVWLAGIKAL
jgi:hypothetical protein